MSARHHEQNHEWGIMRTGIEISFKSRYKVRKKHLLHRIQGMDLRQHLSRKDFMEHAAGITLDIKNFEIESWAMAK
jgi:hypothetical protein